MTDYRLPEHRRTLFQRFYAVHLRYRSHPGGVYYVLRHMADAYGWDAEQRAWAAWINGNTQNPVTTALLMAAGDRPARVDSMLNWFADNQAQLSWDTDRRYHRKAFPEATLGYLAATEGNQNAFWQRASRGGWNGVWKAARSLPTMGRLSAWSYLEYLRLLGVGAVPDADTLLLTDIDGSRSHRNGLLLVRGDEDLMWWRLNPGFHPRAYTPRLLRDLASYGEGLLSEARTLNPGNSDVGYLTLESALCTFKSWHLPNRRYTGVYNDMLYDRLRQAESRFGKRFDVIWDARAHYLPQWMRMEKTDDPGAVPVKQNHFLETGMPVGLGYEYPELWSDYDERAFRGEYRGLRKWA